MRWIVVAVALVAPAVRADVPTELAGDRVELLDGVVALQLAAGALVDPAASRASLDWGDARLTIVARDAGVVRASAMRDWITSELRHEGLAAASIVPLAIARPGLAFGAAIRAPRVRDGRRLVYAAFACNREGRVSELAFYVAGDAELDAWARLAARMASTIRVSDPRGVPPPAVAMSPPPPSSVKNWASCRVTKPGEPDPNPLSAADATRRAPMAGKSMLWSVWEDSSGWYAERPVADEQLICTAKSRMELYQLVRNLP